MNIASWLYATAQISRPKPALMTGVTVVGYPDLASWLLDSHFKYHSILRSVNVPVWFLRRVLVAALRCLRAALVEGLKVLAKEVNK